MTNETNMPPGPTRGMKPVRNRGMYCRAMKSSSGRTMIMILVKDQWIKVPVGVGCCGRAHLTMKKHPGLKESRQKEGKVQKIPF